MKKFSSLENYHFKPNCEFCRLFGVQKKGEKRQALTSQIYFGASRHHAPQKLCYNKLYPPEMPMVLTSTTLTR